MSAAYDMFTADSQDESMQASDHMGEASAVNQSQQPPAGRSLFMLWLVVLGLYWGFGYLFRGERS